MYASFSFTCRSINSLFWCLKLHFTQKMVPFTHHLQILSPTSCSSLDEWQSCNPQLHIFLALVFFYTFQVQVTCMVHSRFVWIKVTWTWKLMRIKKCISLMSIFLVLANQISQKNCFIWTKKWIMRTLTTPTKKNHYASGFHLLTNLVPMGRQCRQLSSSPATAFYS